MADFEEWFEEYKELIELYVLGNPKDVEPIDIFDYWADGYSPEETINKKFPNQ